ncbi:hypothetical protein BJ170DRAFT_688113 [Xylariales sp. AK1849]|nr:hypothetical protein BJ170DRAFT_688113 [Xylariales sp. AK1849]
MTEMEETYRSWIAAINEERWDDVTKYMHPDYEHGSTTSSPISRQDFVAFAKQNKESLSGTITTIDGIIADTSSHCLASRLFLQFTLITPFMGQEPTGKKDGKLFKLLMTLDLASMQQQMTSGEDAPPDHMGVPGPAEVKPLSSDELKTFYEAYIAAINGDLTESALEAFCHPTVIHNAKTLSLEEYCAPLSYGKSAVRDMKVHIYTVIADEKSQRVAARVEFAGTPTKELAGIQPNGKTVRFPEQVMYQFESGKIARVWGPWLIGLDSVLR